MQCEFAGKMLGPRAELSNVMTVFLIVSPIALRRASESTIYIGGGLFEIGVSRRLMMRSVISTIPRRPVAAQAGGACISSGSFALVPGVRGHAAGEAVDHPRTDMLEFALGTLLAASG